MPYRRIGEMFPQDSDAIDRANAQNGNSTIPAKMKITMFMRGEVASPYDRLEDIDATKM